MARLNDNLDSEDELPDLFSILRLRTEASIRTQPKTPRQAHGNITYREKEGKELATEYSLTERHAIASGTFTDVYSDRPQSGKQRLLGHLKQAHVNSLLLPPSDASVKSPRHNDGQSIEEVDGVSGRASPKRLANSLADRLGKVSADAVNRIHRDDSFDTDLSGFIVPDSATDGESPLSKSPKKKKKQKQKQKQKQEYRSPKISTANPDEPGSQEPEQPQLYAQQLSGKNSLALPDKRNISGKCLESLPSSEPLRSELIEANPSLDESITLSSSRPIPPYEYEDSHHSLTPPCSPSIPKLKSPSKRHRIPPSPHRPSVDAFWSQDVIDHWNEQYSPGKIFESPRKVQFHSVDEDEYLSHSQSTYKSPSTSPAKTDKKILEQRKLFKERKQELAIAFLAEVDRTITSGQVASMADSTGGIRIIWSKKLSSTAGRANWRREIIRSKNADGFVSNTFHRHHASIELAEKVIDDEDRLINVIAHEYCHLANFMINGVKDNPHGKEFKEWAHKCNKGFSHRGINVTTKHTYTIAYKYIWTCISPTCGLEYKRHSKSIDPSKHSCGNCKGRLVQVQPAPRKGMGEGKRSVYQEFVKQENQRVRLENPGATFGEIMAILGRDFKERKRNEAKRLACVEDDGALGTSGSSEPDYLDAVVRKIDFLDLSP